MVKKQVKDASDGVDNAISDPIDLKKTSSEPETMDDLLSQTGYTLKGLKRGDIVKGLILDIASRGIRMDIGAKTEGMVIGKELEMARDTISKLKIGDTVTAFVTQVENDEGQILLSLRRAGLDKKWKELEEAKKQNTPVEALGIEVNRGGLLVDVGGLHGFIPASQIDPSRGKGATELVGQTVKVLVIEIDQSKNRLILSEKALTGGAVSAARVEALAKVKIGDIYDGLVSGIVPFGIFVTISVGDGEKKVNADGLVHISEIAWEKVSNPADYFKQSQAVKVMVLGREEKSGKLNLSIKQLTPNPWLKLAEKYTKEQMVTGKVARVAQFGVFVELEPGVLGLIHVSKLTSSKEYTPGETVECIIESVDTAQKRISLAPFLTEKPVGYK